MIGTQTSEKNQTINSKKRAMPSHADQLANLNRIEGQVRGISKMIEEGRYCMDILNQCRSVQAALTGVEKKIFRRFLETCVKEAFRQGKNGETDALMDDIVALLDRK